MKVEVTRVYSFTSILGQGNPAGVVLDAQGLTEQQMMRISQILQVSETAFLFPSENADYHVRFFSPTCEVDLCGHATIAAFTLVGKHHRPDKKQIKHCNQQTRTGILNVDCYYDTKGVSKVLMEQQDLEISSVEYDNEHIASALNISQESFVYDLEKKRVSTGLFTLPICVDSLDTLKQMNPDFNFIKELCERYAVGSFHVFTFDTIKNSSLYHARNFAPCYGINEDPVTGTANGAVCSYLKKYEKIKTDHVICEQGDIINKSGRVQVDLSKRKVWVGGKAAIDTPQILDV